MPNLKCPGLGVRGMGGALLADGLVASVTDADEAYMEYDAASAYARFGAKGNGAGVSRGVKIRTLNVGAIVDAISIAAGGIAGFSAGVQLNGGTFSAGLIYKDASYGLGLGGITGSSADFYVFTPSGSGVLHVPTGTRNVAIDVGNLIVGTDPGGTDQVRSGGSLTATAVRSATGSTSTATGTYTNIYTLPAAGSYQIDWYIANSGGTTMGTARVFYDGSNTPFVVSKAVGTNTDIQISTTVIQIRQTSGSTVNVIWAVSRTQ